MKMMSSTRKMSVSGVMLISATTSSSWPSSALRSDMAMAGLLVFARERELLDAESQERAERVDLAQQPVVRGERENRDDEPRGGGDQRLGDAGRHDVEPA